MNGCLIFVLGFFSQTLSNCSASYPFGEGDNNDNRRFFLRTNYTPQDDQALNQALQNQQEILSQMQQAQTQISNSHFQYPWSGIGQTPTAVPVAPATPHFYDYSSGTPATVSSQMPPTNLQDTSDVGDTNVNLLGASGTIDQGSTSGEGSSEQPTELQYLPYLDLPMVKGHIVKIVPINKPVPEVAPAVTGRTSLIWKEAYTNYPQDIKDAGKKKALNAQWNQFCLTVKLLITSQAMLPEGVNEKTPLFTLLYRLRGTSLLKIHYTWHPDIFIYSDLVKCSYSDHSDFFISKYDERYYFILDYIPANGDGIEPNTCLKISWMMKFQPA